MYGSPPECKRFEVERSNESVPGIRLSHQLYRDLTLASEPQGIGAVLRQNWTPLNALVPEHNALWIDAESVESPGNEKRTASTITRTVVQVKPSTRAVFPLLLI